MLSPPPSYDSGIEGDPLLHEQKKQQTVFTLPSFTNKLSLLLIVAAFSLYHISWWVLWDAGRQNGNLLQWEKELEMNKVQEMRREMEWEQELEMNRVQEMRREMEWEQELKMKRMQEMRREMEWDRKVDSKRKKERAREARWHMSQEQRERLGLRWDEPLAGPCISYGVRTYQARLLVTAGYDYNPIVPCREMTLNIQGVSLNASRCESRGNEIWGHWKIENDPFCTPIFHDWREDACVAPGSRRRLASARLDYISSKEEGAQLCASTPIRFKDMHFNRPLTCEWSIWGLWGHWEYDDDSC
ncbi:hypothetical protein FIBSPDRAFT_958082 [Athelia psychrophila]|uniref:Uncharacterized protein n=1 Tax=Athelia psychrophila TaxID=1759441 RepID=A0A166F2B8_9AGAM|nr:hypothetical protein FIBSPDRAFT_958082 [Fibularhizoctonia sp. CBS 109695]